MLQVFVDILSLDLEDSLFAAFVDAEVHLELSLDGFKAHNTTVLLVHIKDVTSKQTTLTSTSSLHHFKSTVTLICIVLRNDFLDDLLCELFDLLKHLFQLLLSYVFHLLLFILCVDDGVAFAYLVKHRF